MEPNANNDQNAGAASPGNPNPSDQGGQGANPAPSSGEPAGQNGNQPNSGVDSEKEQLRKDNIALNRALVEARRNGRQNNPGAGNNNNGQDNPFDTESGRYGVALELADARLRGGLEERINLYPELPPDVVQRIRLNPWAFASRQSFLSGDFESALDEVEMQLLEKANELSGQNPNAQGNPANPQGDGQGTPANVNNNPAPEPPAADAAVPGSEEDTNPWTMPLGKLEVIAKKEMAANST